MGTPVHSCVEHSVPDRRCHVVTAVQGFARTEDESAGNTLRGVDHDRHPLGRDLDHCCFVPFDARPILGIPTLLRVRPHTRSIGDASGSLDVGIGGVTLVGDTFHDPVELVQRIGIGAFHPSASGFHPAVEVVETRLVSSSSSLRSFTGSPNPILEIPRVLTSLRIMSRHPGRGLRVEFPVPGVEERRHLRRIHHVATGAVPRPEDHAGLRVHVQRRLVVGIDERTRRLRRQSATTSTATQAAEDAGDLTRRLTPRDQSDRSRSDQARDRLCGRLLRFDRLIGAT